MQKEKIDPCGIYLTYDSSKRMLHACRAAEGTTGFLDYMRRDMTFVLQNGYNPNLWMSHYEFTDSRAIPPIREGAMEGYLDAVALAAEHHGGRCLHTVNMGDIFFCITKEIVPLTPDAERSKIMQRSDYPDPLCGYGHNMPQVNAILPEYRAYQALETSAGIVLFSLSAEGERQRKAYEQYHESNFFNPAQPAGKLRYWEIIADPFQMQGQVDRLSPQGSDFTQAYVDPCILTRGHLLREFDLTPNKQNELAFIRRDLLPYQLHKPLLQMSLSELWDNFTRPSHLHSQGQMLCTENQNFLPQTGEVTYKKRI